VRKKVENRGNMSQWREKPEKGEFAGNYGKAHGYAHFFGKNEFT